MDDANIDLAVGALWGAFGTTGRTLHTATSRLIVHKDVAKKMIEKLVERAKRKGGQLDETVQMGTCINESQRQTASNT